MNQPIRDPVFDLFLESPDAREPYRELRRRWPQINGHTRVQYVSYPQVFIPVERPVRSWTETILVNISGWRRLKTYLFPSERITRRLDNPDQRWLYTQNLWWALVRVPTYSFWRWLGRLFHRRSWERRGMEETIDPRGPALETETLDLIKFGWPTYYNTIAYMGFAYHAKSDTLFVYDPRRP